MAQIRQSGLTPTKPGLHKERQVILPAADPGQILWRKRGVTADAVWQVAKLVTTGMGCVHTGALFHERAKQP